MSFFKGKNKKSSDNSVQVTEYSGQKEEGQKGKKVQKDDWDDFKESHNSLFLDYAADQKKKVKFANSLAAISFVVAVGAVGWHITNPLTVTEPFVLRVDNSTGAVDVLTTVKDQETTQGVAVDRYWNAEFVRSFESYNYQTIQYTYDKTNAMASINVRNQYKKLYEGRYARHEYLGQNGSREVSVSSVIIDNNGTAPVARIRFKTNTFVAGQPVTEFWVATVGYTYDKKAIKDDKRLLNPLGFTVLSYTVSSEVVQ